MKEQKCCISKLLLILKRFHRSFIRNKNCNLKLLDVKTSMYADECYHVLPGMLLFKKIHSWDTSLLNLVT